MPALVLWCLAGCPTGLPQFTSDTDAAPSDTDGGGGGGLHRLDLDAEILYPAHGDTVELGDTVYLEGEARVDGEVYPGAEFRWVSSNDGFLGDDDQVPWRPSTLGEDVIELEVRVGNAEDRDQIDLFVEP